MPTPIDPTVAAGPQPAQPDESRWGLLTAATAAGGVAASGFIPVRGKGRLWDSYISAIRGMETASPGAVLRTFRISETLSPLETWSKIGLSQQTVLSRGVYGEYLRRILGAGIEEAELVRTGRVLGELRTAEGKVIGYGMQIAAGTQRSEAIADYFARIAGVPISEKLSMAQGALYSEWQTNWAQTGVAFEDWLDWPENKYRQPRIPLLTRLREEVKIGGRRFRLSEKQSRILAQGELVLNYARARMATTVGRLNNLLQKPFEIPVLGKALGKIPFLRSMAIEPGTSTQMWGRYIKKGIAAGLLWKGLEYYDYLRAHEQPAAVAAGTIGGAAIGGFMFKKAIQPFSKRGALIGAATGLYTAISPRFEHGLFHGAASLVTDANLIRARFSDTVGLTDQLQSVEQIAPGLLSPGAALASAGAGMMLGGVASYGKLMFDAARVKAQKQMPFSEIVEHLRGQKADRLEKRWADTVGKRLARIPVIGKKLAGMKVRSPMMLGAIAGLGAWAAASSTVAALSGNFLAAIPGLNLLGTTENAEQLEKWYSGEEEVPIRKGRWWEFGRSTAYEGGRIMYYRPHFMARLKERAFQKGMWGTEEERWEHEPLLNPLKAIFGSDEWKYAYELKHQYDRPAPLTSTYFEDVPFAGPLLAATAGKLLKPRKFVRADEWMLGEGRYKHVPGRPETEPAYELGGLPAGAPVAPEDTSQLLNELLYRRREAVGLVGFAAGALQKEMTGREEMFQNLQTMATMGKETGSEYWLWKHLNLGGGFFTTEAVRRFIPRTRSYLERYNPLKAQLPSWFPDDYFIDLRTGNPFEDIPEAEIRLPGPGYVALHPELEGVPAEEYPLAWRAKILGDVAMWSDEYRNTMSQAWRRRDQMSARERQIVEETKMQVSRKKKRRDFSEYRFREDELQTLTATVNEVLSPREIRAEEFGGMSIMLQGVGASENMAETMQEASELLLGKEIQLAVPALEARRYYQGGQGPAMRAVALLGDRDLGQHLADQGLAAQAELENEFWQIRHRGPSGLAGDIGEAYSRAIMTPVEQLTPMSFPSKFYRQRSAIEEYVATEAIGTGAAFWDRPLENFLGPAKEMAEYKLGDEEIPYSTQSRRAVTEYFDILEYVKAGKLAEEAKEDRRWKEHQELRERQKKTQFGVSSFASPMKVMQALPRRERDFFAAFVAAKTHEDRKKIMELVPREEQRLYLGQWMKQEADAIRAKKEANIATKDDDLILNQISMAARSEGISHDEYLEELWWRETNGTVPFAEWLRRKKLEQYFSTRSLPGPDWIGWHPSVDLKDIEVRYLEEEGLDHHEFDLWGDRVRSLARKPYIDDDAVAALSSAEHITDMLIGETEMMENARLMASVMGASNSDIMVSRTNANIGPRFDMDIEDGRQGLIVDSYDDMGLKTLKDY